MPVDEAEMAARRAAMKARADEQRRHFAEAEAAVPEPVETDREAILDALATEGFNKGVRQRPSRFSYPTSDLRSLLHDWRVLRWVNEHYPKVTNDPTR